MSKRSDKPKADNSYADWQIIFLQTGKLPEERSEENMNVYEILDWEFHSTKNEFDSVRIAWEQLRDSILPKWIERYPGTRPYAWWAFDSGLEWHWYRPQVKAESTTDTKIYTMQNTIPEDQRTWLAQRGMLLDGE